MNIRRWSTRDQISFFYRLATYVSAGVPLLEATVLLRDQTKNTSKLVAESLSNAIESGHTLSEGLVGHSYIHPLVLACIRVGEQSGTLSECLRDLVQLLQDHQALQKNLAGAALYPAFIASTTIGIALFLLLYVFPSIMPLLNSMNADLPLATRTLIASSSFMASWWWAVVLCSIATAVAYVLLRKKENFLRIHDHALLHIPLIGEILRLYHLSHITRTLSLLLTRNTPIQQALLVCASTTQNTAYAQALVRASTEVEQGTLLSAELSRNSLLFPDSFIHILTAGERTGSTAKVITTLFQQYDGEFRQATARMVILIEPILMLSMGAFVGYIALAIIMPVYQLSQSLHH